MAIDKQTAPLDSPASLTDWQRLIDITDTLALSFKNPWPVKVVTGTGYIIRGSVFYIGGAWYKANIDVAITGTETDYIQLTVDNINNLVTAAYVATLTDVSWNDQWNGWYDTTGKFYVFDESLAYGAGLIDFPRTVAYSRPKNAETAKANSTAYGNNWARFLESNVDTTDNSALIIGLPNTLYTNYNEMDSKTKPARLFEDGNWYNLFQITLAGANLPCTFEAFRVLWQNADAQTDNNVRILYGADVISTWNDGTQEGIPFNVTGLTIEEGATMYVQYKEDDPGLGVTRGPFTLTLYSSCVNDTDGKPNLFQLLFNINGGGVYASVVS
jgi:hypothetical protein